MVLEEEKPMAVADAEGGGGGGEEEEEEETEYESDPEEVSLSLAMRRREASDDEGDETERKPRTDPRIEIVSDAESDGQGGAAVYDDDDEQSELEDEEDVEEEVEELEEVEEELEERASEEGENEIDVVKVGAVVQESDGDGGRSNGEQKEIEAKDGAEAEKKENEPFAVPTAGAFYMHDDRFRDNGGGRHRWTPGGRKLWESKDDRKWGHDKFEEMNLQETNFEKERRNARGRYRGRGKSRGIERGNSRGNRFRDYDDRNNQNQTTKTVRGRGPRRYEPPARNNRETLPIQNKQSGKSGDTTLQTSSGRLSTNAQTSNVHSDPAPLKNISGSSLNSASPPFYPSASSNQDVSVTQKRDVPIVTTNKHPSPSVMVDDRFSAHPNALFRGKTNFDSVGQDMLLYTDDLIRPIIGKLANMQLQSSGSSPISTTQSPQNRLKGRGAAIPGHAYLLNPSFDHVSKAPQQTSSAVHQRPAQNIVQTSLRASQQLVHHAGSGSRTSSPPKVSPSSSEPGDLDSPPGSSKSKTVLVGKGKTNAQRGGRGTFLYSGAQLMGAAGGMGVAHGDQNFPGAPALLPVMQFGGQHPSGLGVPAVGMALPGYVAQPGPNNEMTWVPFLAGAPGALGATYCSPYLAVDSGYYSRPTGQTSSSGGSSKEMSTNKSNSTWNPPQRSELVNDEFGQRQNKPRRYSEMSFGQ